MTDLSHFTTPAPMHRTVPNGTKLQAVQAVGWPLIGLVTVLVAGCVSLTPPQQSRLTDFKGFTQTVTVAYGKPDVKLMAMQPGDSTVPLAVIRRDGLLLFSPELLRGTSPGQFAYDLGLFAIAHELGHYVTGRFGCPTCEMDANAEAVKILMLGRGMSEREAFDLVANMLAFTASLQGMGTPVIAGHPSACTELANLAGRYPFYGVDTPQACKWTQR